MRPIANLYDKDLTFEGVKFPSAVKKFPKLGPYQAINPYFGIYVPRDTDPAIIEKIAKAFLWAIQQKGFTKVAVKQRAGVLSPKLGVASDKEMSMIESARGTALWDLKIAKNDPPSSVFPSPTHGPGLRMRGPRKPSPGPPALRKCTKSIWPSIKIMRNGTPKSRRPV